MASASSEAQWAWPSSGTAEGDDDASRNDTTTHPPSHEHIPEPTSTTTDTPSSGPAPTPTQQQPPPKQRHYKPRTCRICLEVVHPTTDLDDSLAGRVFPSTRARVRYVSEDPELGRLLSPCRCKGSQKYVHEGCLQAWRNAAPLSDRNYWRCPTCGFEYRLQRLRWGRWLSSKVLRAGLTLVIMVVAVFVLGFVADPIIGFWVDPFGSLAESLLAEAGFDEPVWVADDEPGSWYSHFVKGFLSLGLLGFLKTMFVMSPWNWLNIRVGGGRGRRRGAGRDRMEQINWALVVIGVITFLGATWKFVSHIMAKTLEKASERVVDVQEDNPDEDEDEDAPQPEDTPQESRKDK